MRFTRLEPSEVMLGRGRVAFMNRTLYREALLAGDAGRVERSRNETITDCQSKLRRAARDLGLRIRSSVEGPDSLVWKKYPNFPPERESA